MRSSAMWFGVASALWVLATGYFSWLDGMFFPSQVQTRWGQAGISFFGHGGMWWNLLILPFVGAFIIDRTANDWTGRLLVIALGAGFVMSAINHVGLITGQKIPDPLGWRQQWWSIPIAMHFVFMTVYIALPILYFFSGPKDPGQAAVVAIAFGLDTVFGMHIPLGIANLWGKWAWCPTTFLRLDVLGMQAVPWGLLLVGAFVAGGMVATATVGVAALSILLVVVATMKFAS